MWLACERVNRVPELMDEPRLTGRATAADGGVVWCELTTSSKQRPGAVAAGVAKLAGELKRNRYSRAGMWRLAPATCSAKLMGPRQRATSRRKGQIACDLSRLPCRSDSEQCGCSSSFTTRYNQPLPTGLFDAVTCHCFCTPFERSEAIALLTTLENASGTAPLHRLSRLRLQHCAGCGFGVPHRHAVERRAFDGPASVRYAFTPQEALALEHRPDERVTVQRQFPAGFLISWQAK